MTKIEVYLKNPSYADSDDICVYHVVNSVEEVRTFIREKGYVLADGYWHGVDEDGDETWISVYPYRNVKFSNLEDLV